ncbi:MAG: NAD-dependent epimerase/dehydratase family protein [Bacteroidales bacterium]|nr:NAD-dependent epimerase/dehydratase family protein [Bacteroidales bacterium]
MRILITGVAGFIGMNIAKTLLERGLEVVGIDNINSYYDTKLKFDRLAVLGINNNDPVFDKECLSDKFKNFIFIKTDICSSESLRNIFDHHSFDVVCNLAAQAGVRYSLINPKAYIDTNINGFFNLIEQVKSHNINHFVYASSSSVYGSNEKTPYSCDDKTDSPVSIYAATKKSNELLAYSYSSIYKFHTTGLRFFTVYGPWGRPDMAPFLFTDAILNNRPITVYNNGEMWRDFTFIDDLKEAVANVICSVVDEKVNLARVYNIGNNQSVLLSDFIRTTENICGKKAEIIYKPMQKGDVLKTFADIEPMKRDYGYNPHTNIKDGMNAFVEWYKDYFNK